MRIQDAIYFSPQKRLEEMTRASEIEWAIAWEHRIEGYYLEPLRLLIRKDEGFASLVMLSTAIEAVGTIKYRGLSSGQRFRKTVRYLLQEEHTVSDVLYRHYRNGLVHNGRTNQTRNGNYHQNNEFSVIDFGLNKGFKDETPQRVVVKLYSVNPRILSDTFSRNFHEWIAQDFAVIGELVKQEFEGDLEYLRVLKAG